MFNFLQENKIMDMVGLEAKVQSMQEKQFDIRDKLKSAERRLKTLDEHIRQVEMHQQYKAVYRQYQEQKPKKKAAFAEQHRGEIALFESAERYLKGVMNGKTTLPIKTWKVEHAKLTAEQNRLRQEYTLLKMEVREVEQIKQSVRGMLREKRRVHLETER